MYVCVRSSVMGLRLKLISFMLSLSILPPCVPFYKGCAAEKMMEG